MNRNLHLISLFSILRFFITSYLLGFTKFFTNETIKLHSNFKRIKFLNHGYFLLFLIVISLIIWGVHNLPIHNFFNAILSALIYVLKFLFSFYKQRPNDLESEAIPQNKTVADFSHLGKIAPQNSIWLLIQEILLYIFYGAATILGFILLIYCIYQLYKKFLKEEQEKDHRKEFIYPFFKEEKIEKEKKKRSQPIFILKDNNEKVRHLFFLQVKKNFKGKVPSNLTARELLALSEKSLHTLLEKRESFVDEELLILYHKARYSTELCTKEDVMNVKSRTSKK